VSETLRSVCALDCPDCCSLLLDVDENGRGTKLRGNPAHPVTRGFLCGKVARYLEREYSPSRLLYPMRRAGPKGDGRFARISWDDALDEIAEKLRAIQAEYGSEAILPYSYAGTMGLLNGAGMDRRFFHRLGASRLDRTICSSAGGAGLIDALGVKYGADTEAFSRAKLIVAWGANVLGTNVHLWPFIVEARRNGAKFYTIDPREHRAAKTADHHFAIRPGSDTALAFGMMHVIIAEKLFDADYVERYTSGFEELQVKMREWTPARVSELTGIDAEAIVQLARSSGVVMIASSGTKQYATEFADLKHGVFTYALLEALDGKADNGDKKLTVNELKFYMEDRVPELTKQHGGQAQYPTGYITGNDFPISVYEKK